MRISGKPGEHERVCKLTLILIVKSLVTAVVQFLTKVFGQEVMNDVAVSGFAKLMALMEEYCVVTDDDNDDWTCVQRVHLVIVDFFIHSHFRTV